jgi:hypothetical protein
MDKWTSPGHLSKISAGIIDGLSKEFYKMLNGPDEEKNHELLIKLSSAIGYQGMMYNTLWKSNKLHERIEALEQDMDRPLPEDVAMAQSPVLLEESKLRAQAEFT